MAINSMLVLGPNISAHPHIKCILGGAALLNPPVVHRFPSWDPHVVFQGLMVPPFEPLAKVSLKHLTFNTLFLVAITSARRVSKVGALSVNPNLCIFHKDRVVLCTDSVFVPKINILFHREQELVLPSFCPQPDILRSVNGGLWTLERHSDSI